ncbi:MAG: Hsp20/alpha crystallin family protein [Acidimicrobiia bacterium]
MALPVRSRSDGPPESSPWGPLAELDRLSRELTRYLDTWRGEGFTPLADLEETAEAYLVEVEVPGVKREDIDIEVAGRRVWVRGERKEKERVGILRRRERVVGRFACEVVLPGDVDEEGVHANLDGGVLTVTLPKPERDRPRRIEIR